MARTQEPTEQVEELEKQLKGEVVAALALLAVLLADNEDEEDEDAALIIVLGLPSGRRAIRVLLRWVEEAASFVTLFPISMDDDGNALDVTTAQLKRDIEVNYVWASTKGANSLVARMTWLTNWLKETIKFLDTLQDRKFTQKTWMSRLRPETCTYCRKLHGVTIPIWDSFREHAIEVGWTRIYGALYNPPLHPNCQCRLIYS